MPPPLPGGRNVSQPSIFRTNKGRSKKLAGPGDEEDISIPGKQPNEEVASPLYRAFVRGTGIEQEVEFQKEMMEQTEQSIIHIAGGIWDAAKQVKPEWIAFGAGAALSAALGGKQIVKSAGKEGAEQVTSRGIKYLQGAQRTPGTKEVPVPKTPSKVATKTEDLMPGQAHPTSTITRQTTGLGSNPMLAAAVGGVVAGGIVGGVSYALTRDRHSSTEPPDVTVKITEHQGVTDASTTSDVLSEHGLNSQLGAALGISGATFGEDSFLSEPVRGVGYGLQSEQETGEPTPQRFPWDMPDQTGVLGTGKQDVPGQREYFDMSPDVDLQGTGVSGGPKGGTSLPFDLSPDQFGGTMLAGALGTLLTPTWGQLRPHGGVDGPGLRGGPGGGGDQRGSGTGTIDEEGKGESGRTSGTGTAVKPKVKRGEDVQPKDRVPELSPAIIEEALAGYGGGNAPNAGEVDKCKKLINQAMQQENPDSWAKANMDELCLEVWNKVKSSRETNNGS